MRWNRRESRIYENNSRLDNGNKTMNRNEKLSGNLQEKLFSSEWMYFSTSDFISTRSTFPFSPTRTFSLSLFIHSTPLCWMGKWEIQQVEFVLFFYHLQRVFLIFLFLFLSILPSKEWKSGIRYEMIVYFQLFDGNLFMMLAFLVLFVFCYLNS